MTLAEKEDRLGGQFNLAWQAPGKQKMQDGWTIWNTVCRANADAVITDRAVDADLVNKSAGSSGVGHRGGSEYPAKSKGSKASTS